jgi:DcmR-like sensory protein
MLAAVIRQKVQRNYRCLFLNSKPMVAGMQSRLAAAGVDVAHEIGINRLVLTSGQDHLVDGRHFDVDRMISSLEEALDQAVQDGHEGLWATGDMYWELGPENDFSKLLEYEWRLEQLLSSRPQIGGICQYHANTPPRAVLREGLLTHRGIFLNETLTQINPHYLPPESFTPLAFQSAEIENALDVLCSSGFAN